MKSVETFAIIVAGGKGLRMGSSTKKQYLKLNNIPVLAKTLMVFDKCKGIHHLILVVPKEDKTYCQQLILDPYCLAKPVHLTEGGEQRQISVFKGLKVVEKLVNTKKESIVLIHDGVRPFLSDQLITACIKKAIVHGACIPGIKIAETIKKVKNDNLIQKTVDRENLYAAQTPQVFRFSLLFSAYMHAQERSFTGTDDASLVEEMGKSVCIITGSKNNIKITTPQDLIFAEYLSRIKDK